jgi:cell division protein FtsI (penicillin-binding protein 3)
MRKMMEGVVLYGTGKQAQLNGYSSGGKTGTAQKIDPATHLYSKTMHVASFAGIAPVNNPAISVAVIIDNPKGAAYYGAEVSAPVFAEVAQQVLEYLGVPHDIDFRVPSAPVKNSVPVVDDNSAEHSGDIEALYAAANELPSDDPLREGGSQAQTANRQNIAAQSAGQTTGSSGNASAASRSLHPTLQAKPSNTATAVTLNQDKKLQVPSLIGLPMRKIIELAAAAGLEVQISGSGRALEQAPAAGTMVTAGTKIVVKCGR